MRYGYALPIVGVCLCFMASCASPPTLVYKTFPANGETKSSIVKAGKGAVKEPATTQPTDPADSEFAMAKQVSTVVLSMPGAVAKAKKDEEQPPASRSAKPMDVREAMSLDVPTGLTCGGAEEDGWAQCFDGVQTITAPHVDMNYIFAVRQGDSMSLDVTTGEHPLQVTAVTSKWTNTTAEMLAKIGSNATLGYAAGGPIGAAVVVIGGAVFDRAVAGNKDTNYASTILFGATWDDAVKAHYLCQGEDTRTPDLKAPLLLPVAFDLDNSLPADDPPAYAGCWHRFPQGDGPYTNQAWLYRVVDWTEADSASVKDPTVQLVPPVLDERKPGASADKLGIIKSDGTSGLISQAEADAIAKASPDEAWIPASACHAVRLQVTRAEEIIAASGQNRPAGHHDVKQFKDFDIVIADPRWNQLMRVTKGTRTITFGLCGGTAKGTQGSSEIADDIKAAAELVKTVKGLQSSSGKSGQ